jgi:predicted alpha/beta-hydrolase family hydrolase
VLAEERIETKGILARLYLPSGAEGLLLLGHGGGKSKDSNRFVELSRLYAESTGLAVVCIDAVDHGERKPVDVDDDPPAGWHSEAIAQMVND